MEKRNALIWLEGCKIEDIKAMEKEGLFKNVRLLRTARELNDCMIDQSLEELIHNIEGIPDAMRETRRETMQVADAFRAKMRRAIGTDRIEELVEHGRFSTFSDTVEIALEELIHNIEGIPHATRCETMQVADAFRAKMRSGNGTLIGAAAKVVTALAERAGHPYNGPLEGFVKVAMPIMLVSILVASIYILLRF